MFHFKKMIEKSDFNKFIRTWLSAASICFRNRMLLLSLILKCHVLTNYFYFIGDSGVVNILNRFLVLSVGHYFVHVYKRIISRSNVQNNNKIHCEGEDYFIKDRFCCFSQTRTRRAAQPHLEFAHLFVAITWTAWQMFNS